MVYFKGFWIGLCRQKGISLVSNSRKTHWYFHSTSICSTGMWLCSSLPLFKCYITLGLEKQSSLGLELSLEKLRDPPCYWMRITLKKVKNLVVVVIPCCFFWRLSVAVLCCLVVIPAHPNVHTQTNTNTHTHTYSNTATKPHTQHQHLTAQPGKHEQQQKRNFPIISGEMLQL